MESSNHFYTLNNFLKFSHIQFFLFNRIPICNLVNSYFTNLARKFPQTKFLRSVSSVCIPNYPDHNLPTIFIYFENDLKKQWVGPLALGGMNLKQDGQYFILFLYFITVIRLKCLSQLLYAFEIES